MHITTLAAECSRELYRNHFSMHLLLVPFTGHLFISAVQIDDITKGLRQTTTSLFPKTGGERKMTLAQTPKKCDSEEASRKKLHTLL